MIGNLPTSLMVGDSLFSIRTDFRDVLTILCAFNDPELPEAEKIYVCLFILYEDFGDIPQTDYEDAFKAALDFIDAGIPTSHAKSPRIMDWEQDATLIFPAINKIAGFETRAADNIHWWTFMGYYMEISEGVFSHVLAIRMKRAKGKKLEKWEREYWNSNKDICVLKEKLSAEEQAERNRINALLN